MEMNPDRFMRREAPVMLRQAASHLARFMHADAEDVVLGRAKHTAPSLLLHARVRGAQGGGRRAAHRELRRASATGSGCDHAEHAARSAGPHRQHNGLRAAAGEADPDLPRAEYPRARRRRQRSRTAAAEPERAGRRLLRGHGVQVAVRLQVLLFPAREQGVPEHRASRGDFAGVRPGIRRGVCDPGHTRRSQLPDARVRAGLL
ncbi:hypothetical protein ON010_g18237 [Phytophthora cinnamomi]|nr:hypothetical protein ON010_g18237 [Phytophthora cinnamomi]